VIIASCAGRVRQRAPGAPAGRARGLRPVHPARRRRLAARLDRGSAWGRACPAQV